MFSGCETCLKLIMWSDIQSRAFKSVCQEEKVYPIQLFPILVYESREGVCLANVHILSIWLFCIDLDWTCLRLLSRLRFIFASAACLLATSTSKRTFLKANNVYLETYSLFFHHHIHQFVYRVISYHKSLIMLIKFEWYANITKALWSGWLIAQRFFKFRHLIWEIETFTCSSFVAISLN